MLQGGDGDLVPSLPPPYPNNNVLHVCLDQPTRYSNIDSSLQFHIHRHTISLLTRSKKDCCTL